MAGIHPCFVVEQIWDCIREFKTYYTTPCKRRSLEKSVNYIAGGNSDFVDLHNEEIKLLTSIENKYRIRHHETNKIDITYVRYYDYLFNCCLSLIVFDIKHLPKSRLNVPFFLVQQGR